MKNSEEPAYPTPDCEVSGMASQYLGLTKREYFAAMAMQAWISTYRQVDAKTPDEWAEDPQRIANLSIAYAEALLTELEKSNQ